MTLDKIRLKEDLVRLMKAANDEQWGSEQLAGGLATVIHTYVGAAEVVGVTVVAKEGPLSQSINGRLT